MVIITLYFQTSIAIIAHNTLGAIVILPRAPELEHDIGCILVQCSEHTLVARILPFCGGYSGHILSPIRQEMLSLK